MPTPFTHLEIAQRLLVDEALSPSHRELLRDELSAFLLGSVAADARVGAGASREVTHFYAYGEEITVAPWRIMMTQNPTLLNPHHTEQRVFVAAYVAHLAVDEYWSKHMVAPNFVGREWADRLQRFFMLHIILTYMDERDLIKLESWQGETLCQAQPDSWLPFISDDYLLHWRDLIYKQILPAGESQTLKIFGDRLGLPPEHLREVLDSPEQMQSGLWEHVPQTILAETESAMYVYAREQMQIYLEESTP